MTLVKADLGIKRVCPSCGARFYDLQKRPIECPKCAFASSPKSLYKQRRPRQPEPAARRAGARARRGRRRGRRRGDGGGRSEAEASRKKSRKSPSSIVADDEDEEDVEADEEDAEDAGMTVVEARRRRNRGHRSRRRGDEEEEDDGSSCRSRRRRRRRQRHHRRRHQGRRTLDRPHAFPDQGFQWGHSSAGRALEWHSRGQRFDPAWLHQPSLAKRNEDCPAKPKAKPGCLPRATHGKPPSLRSFGWQASSLSTTTGALRSFSAGGLPQGETGFHDPEPVRGPPNS